MPTQKNDKSTWIQLRSGDHLQGRLEIETFRLEIVKGGQLTVYDLRESSKQGQAVIVECRQVNRQK